MTRDGCAGEANGSIHVIEKSAQILDCFSVAAPTLQASEIVRRTGMPTTTVARILRTLVKENLLQREGTVYSIGLRSVVWSSAATAASSVIAAARPLVAALSNQYGECSGLQVRQGNRRIIVVWEQSKGSVGYRGYVGQVNPLPGSAAGKVFMAYEPHVVPLVLEEGLVAYTPKTVVDPAELHDQLQQIREQGWAFAQEECEVGLNCLAVPVHAHDGSVTAAVSVGGPTHRLTGARLKEIVHRTKECARAISQGQMLRANGIAVPSDVSLATS
ncbi:IclR family transcriptional regulator [Streptomyces sp. NPDC002547]